MRKKYDISTKLKKNERKDILSRYATSQKETKKQRYHLPFHKQNKKDAIVNSTLFRSWDQNKKQEIDKIKNLEFKLLKKIIGFLIFIDIIFLVLFQFEPSFFLYGSADLFILISTLFILLFTYVALYFYDYKICVSLLLFSITLPILSNIYISIILFTELHNNISYSIAYLIFPFVISVFCFEKRYSLTYLWIILTSLLITPLLANQLMVYPIILNPFLFFLFTSIIILFFKNHADKIQMIRNIDLAHAKKEIQEILDIAADGIRIVDKHFNVIKANDTMARLSGVQKNEIIGKRCDYSFRSQFCGTSECSVLKVIQTGKDVNRITSRLTSNGEELICLEQVKPYRDENGIIIGAIEDFRDITELKEIEKKLKQERNKAQTYLDVASVILYALDSNGNITLINKKGCEILEYTEEELLGKNWFQSVIPSDKSTHEIHQYKEFISSNMPIPKEMMNKIVTKSGNQRYIQWQLSPVYDEQNDLLGIIGSGIDVTEEIRSKEAKEIADNILEKRSSAFRILYDTVLQIEQKHHEKIDTILCKNLMKISNSTIGFFGIYHLENSHYLCKKYSIVSKDVNDTFIVVNNNKEFTLDTSIDVTTEILKNKIIKCNDLDFLKKVLPIYLIDNFKELSTKNCYLISYPIDDTMFQVGFIVLSDNQKLQMKDMIEALMNLGSLIIQRYNSVIALGESEKRYKDLSNSLDQEVKERTKYIEKLLIQKEEFIHQLGHDLKSPLNPLINLIPVLQKKNNDEDCEKILEILHRNTDHMKNLVTKTLTLAKLNSPATTFSYTLENINDEINEILQRHSYLFKQHDIHVSIDIDEHINIEIDKLRFSELVDNLLTNAVKYSPDGSNIYINGLVNEDNLIISIKDTGIGMSDDQIEQVFDEFYKADGARHDFDSSGLGMSIAKRIIERHHGKIWIESAGLNQGTTIYFSLPLNHIDKKP